jgi:hypothetical protein
MDYTPKLTEAGERTADTLTDPKSYGGAAAWHAHPCVIVYGVPCWITPNGMVRLGDPNAPMIDADHAVRVIRQSNRQSTAPAPTTYTAAQINDALNRAADTVLEATDAGDEGPRDLINLHVNTAAGLLENPEATLQEVIEASYSEPPAVVIGWASQQQ